jgi:diadenosine tetraphosphate (Ap4A) HIT family hydrolase
MSTIFSLIIQGKLPSKKIYEDEQILAIEDIHPVAPIHILIMPKKEIPNLQSLELADYPLMQEIIRIAQKIAE